MEVVVTGASGFVGTNLVAYLNSKNIKSINLSLRNFDWQSHFKPNTQALIHLAGKAHDTSNSSNPEEYYKINRDLTIQVFDLFLKSEIKDFFYFSSVKAVADTIDVPLTEERVPNPVTPYGKSKLEAETYLVNQVLPEGKRLFIIRPSMIHGPGNKGNLNLLYKIVRKGLPWPLGAFTNQRSFLSIDNLCFMLLQILLNRKIESGIYNFADDGLVSTNELIGIIGSSLGRKTKIYKIPKLIISNLVKVGDYFPFPINSERLKKLTESYIVSNTKIKSALNISNLPLTSEAGLLKTLNSFQTSNT